MQLQMKEAVKPIEEFNKTIMCEPEKPEPVKQSAEAVQSWPIVTWNFLTLVVTFFTFFTFFAFLFMSSSFLTAFPVFRLVYVFYIFLILYIYFYV